MEMPLLNSTISRFRLACQDGSAPKASFTQRITSRTWCKITSRTVAISSQNSISSDRQFTVCVPGVPYLGLMNSSVYSGRFVVRLVTTIQAHSVWLCSSGTDRLVVQIAQTIYSATCERCTKTASSTTVPRPGFTAPSLPLGKNPLSIPRRNASVPLNVKWKARHTKKTGYVALE